MQAAGKEPMTEPSGHPSDWGTPCCGILVLLAGIASLGMAISCIGLALVSFRGLDGDPLTWDRAIGGVMCFGVPGIALVSAGAFYLKHPNAEESETSTQDGP